MEFMSGIMAGPTTATFKTIIEMAMVSFLTQIGTFITKDSGRMAISYKGRLPVIERFSFIILSRIHQPTRNPILTTSLMVTIVTIWPENQRISQPLRCVNTNPQSWSLHISITKVRWDNTPLWVLLASKVYPKGLRCLSWQEFPVLGRILGSDSK